MTSPVPLKNLLSLLGLSAIFITLILSLNAARPSLLPGRGELMLTGGFAISALASIIVFFRGAGKNPETSVFATLIALGIKLLLSLVLALLFFLVLKNRDTASIILFFILYLAFTVFVILTFLSVLKKMSV
ncbi:MAG: hypothetical protein P1P83_08945 [Bacteroidales bacterium]|nr:hypothetical protein [Bacteroidales bacterium]MDT8373634.1 hypothetical protein [Bacteroidales bacterium]